jgi:hypothetical protein
MGFILFLINYRLKALSLSYRSDTLFVHPKTNNISVKRMFVKRQIILRIKVKIKIRQEHARFSARFYENQ